MLTRSNAASSAGAAAPASLSTLTAAATHGRAHSSLNADAHTNTQAHAQDQVEGVMGAADAANAAVASQPLSALASGPSLSGRKRAADDPTDAAAQHEGDADSPHALTEASGGDSSTSAESKKHRGESARYSRAAFTAGFEATDGEPTSAVAASPSNGRSGSADDMADVSSAAGTNECQEESQAAGSGVVAVRASAAASSSSSIAAAHADNSTAAPHLDDQLRLAIQLLAEGIPLAQGELQRYEERIAPLRAASTQQRAGAQTQLQIILALPAAQQVARQAQQVQLHLIVSECTQTLAMYAQFSLWVRRAIGLARAHRADLAVPFRALGYLCKAMRNFVSPTLLANSPNDIRAWMMQVDALFTQLADRLLQLTLTADECDKLLLAALQAGALQLVPVLMQQPNMRDGCDAFSSGLVHSCLESGAHVVSRQPYLRLFEYGLDPMHIFPEQSPQSALQLARNFIRDHPLSAVHAAEPSVMAPAAAAAASSASAFAAVQPIPSMLAAWAAQRKEPTEEAEDLRLDALHAQFMHALVPAWLSHSRAVLGLLSSPAVLIPDLAVIVGRYLDLEGLPAGRAVSVAENDADAEAEQ